MGTTLSDLRVFPAPLTLRTDAQMIRQKVALLSDSHKWWIAIFICQIILDCYSGIS